MENIIYGLSNEDYHSSPPYSEYLSSSQLKLYAHSPKYARYMMDNPQPQTEAQRFGSLFHDLMAGFSQVKGEIPEDLVGKSVNYHTIVFEPPINDKTGKPYGVGTKAYNEALDKIKETYPFTEIVGRQEQETLQGMLQSVLFGCGTTSEQVRKLLKWGKPEVSIFYETEEGIKLKVRPDLLTSNKIVDWKSFAGDDLTEESINRVILRYGYHISAAQYQYVYNKVTGKWVTFYLVFVQKQPPYDCVMVDMSNYGYRYIKDLDMVQMGPGAIEFDRLLKLHTKCLKSGEWPGAETFIPGDKYRIMEIEPPRYYANRFMED
ncbi:MAG: PD-(D/E)XK nuclease-like domain-containing protein [Muribaculaceae bacterium]|nr:PD-(D/E)XK nuclease-like domain-containing protein [Muribaculaceae bacterium]